MDWKSIASSRQEHRSNTIDAVHPAVPRVSKHLPRNVTAIPKQLLPQHVIEITELPPEKLLGDLATGKISSEKVTRAFLQRAGLASKLTNCVTELLPDRAIARAKHLDEYLSRHGKPTGPLHGLPISVKEHVAMKGLDLNAGFVAWVGRIAEDDALILKLLWQAGAVFHARTTEPQTLMHLETSNNIYGVTVNPYNTDLTSGGSSGGEGALLGLKGSPLGIGTDIGGSIRSPAANNGVFGLRPTTHRLPVGGLAATMHGQEHIVPVIGPLSQSLEGVKVFMKALIDQKPWLYEPSLLPFPWQASPDYTLLRRGADGRRKLRIGVLADDGIVRPHPPILRGINTLSQRLQSNPDIEVVDFPPYKHDEAWKIASTLYFADGGSEEAEAIEASGEPWRPLSKFILKENPSVKALTVPETWEMTGERDAYREAYARYWNSINTGLPGPDSGVPLAVDAAAAVSDKMVDVILTPVGPGCAPLLDTARYWNYASQWNLLDYPALVFPTGLYCGPEDGAEREYTPRNERDAYNYNLYEPEKYRDAPISLQLVGRRYEDEKLIEALEMILETYKTPVSSTSSKL
ncbi:related to vitamin D3 hydroxylase-associated [Lecanosticta acicola]|uniref:amidase n=1 Tax=Lecanosticta acicola TaxID=111012 RepID=A0AAI8Z083_9PEZI|nr:related to vitamin D3 hydroxylase-associated [Lecanosticta acicola]